MRFARFVVSVALVGLVVGCGATPGTTDSTAGESTGTSVGAGASSTTTSSIAAETTTTTPGFDTTVGSESVSLDDLPPECVEPIKTFVEDIEPVVSVFDYETGTLEDFEQMTIGLLPIVSALYGVLQATPCVGTTGPIQGDAYPALIAFAQQEAPGSVAWLEVQRDVQDYPYGEGCSEYIENLQTYVEQGGTVFDLTVAERFHAYNLFGSVMAWCPLQTGGEYSNRPEVLAFMVLDPA